MYLDLQLHHRKSKENEKVGKNYIVYYIKSINTLNTVHLRLIVSGSNTLTQLQLEWSASVAVHYCVAVLNSTKKREVGPLSAV